MTYISSLPYIGCTGDTQRSRITQNTLLVDCPLRFSWDVTAISRFSAARTTPQSCLFRQCNVAKGFATIDEFICYVGMLPKTSLWVQVKQTTSYFWTGGTRRTCDAQILIVLVRTFFFTQTGLNIVSPFHQRRSILITSDALCLCGCGNDGRVR